MLESVPSSDPASDKSNPQRIPRRVVQGDAGALLIEGEIVLSEVLEEPGLTHSLFDVLAAAVAILSDDARAGGSPSEGARFGLLGFAAGGIVAPARALGFRGDVHGVDCILDGERLFRATTRFDPGAVKVEEEDAYSWLERQRKPFDVILDDLSIPLGPRDVTKPALCYQELPELIESRLGPGGAAIFNLLPCHGWRWNALLDHVASPFTECAVVTFDDYENRLLLAGHYLDSAASLSRRLRNRLRDEGYRGGSWSLRTLE